MFIVDSDAAIIHSFILSIHSSSFFHIQIVLVVLAIGLVVFALYDVIFTYRESGDPTRSVIDMTGISSTTINNPGFRDGRGNGN